MGWEFPKLLSEMASLPSEMLWSRHHPEVTGDECIADTLKLNGPAFSVHLLRRVNFVLSTALLPV